MPLIPSRVQRIPPQALYFDGVDDYVDLPLSLRSLTNPTISGATAMVLFAPLKVHDSSWDNALVGGRAYHWFLSIPNNTPTAYIYNSAAVLFSVSSNTVIPIGVWASAAAVYGTDYSIRIYVNGSLKGTGSWSDSFTEATDYMRVGMRSRIYVNAFIAQVLLYSRPLSPDEILWNYNNPDNPIRNGLVLWLHWDSIDINAGVWYDKSGNGNHGKIYGATLVQIIKKPSRILKPTRVLTPVR